MLEDRRDRLDDLLDEAGLAAVWVAEPNTVAWLTGADTVISESSPQGVAAVGYDGEGLTALTSNIERDRLRDEELPEDCIVEAFAWHESELATAVAERSPRPAAADLDVDGLESLEEVVDAHVDGPLRTPLSTRDRRRYRRLGEDTAAAVEAAARTAEPGDTERELAARVAGELTDRGIRSPVLLVGGARRAQEYRHFTVTGEQLGDFVHVSTVGVRDGLHASVTRTVCFDRPRWFDRRTEAAARVEATALAASREAGRNAEDDRGDAGTAADVFAAIEAAYEEVGHPEEWRHHHQGGAIGYAAREWKATPTLETPIELPTAFAYNPTVQGAKSEGTWIAAGDGVESLTGPGEEWPSMRAAAVGFDAEYTFPAPLVREP